MITSFFAPKSKKSGSKRPRTTNGENEDSSSATTNTKQKRGVATPSSSSASSLSLSSSSSSDKKTKSKAALTEETAALLSYLHQHDNNGVETDEQSLSLSSSSSSWRGALEKHFCTTKFTSLAKFIAKERASKTVYPPPELTFSALNLTPLHKVKVVIVGQDPYHQPNQGHGLSFSVPPGIKIPPSLRNIYKELCNDSSIDRFTSMPQHGNLERWAKQGVLLLNNVLTVRRGEAASHKKRGWEDFTDMVIGAVVERDAQNDDDAVDDEEAAEEKDNENKGTGTGVVFLLWGKPASAKAQTVLAKYSNNKRAKHAVIMSSHPSPLGATKTSSPFTGSRCFSRANEELVKRGWAPIDWRVDGPLENDDDDDDDDDDASTEKVLESKGKEEKLGEGDQNFDV